MKLPFSDEIRAARARSEASHAAEIDRIHLQSTVIEIEQLLAAPRLPDHVELPGVQWTGSDLPPDLSLRERLQLQRQVVAHQYAVVSEVASNAVEDAQTLHTLQHRQHHALADPQYAEIVEELNRYGSARDEAALSRMNVEHARASVHMLVGLVGGAVIPLTLARGHDDPSGADARAAAIQARTHLFQIGDAFAGADLTVQMPVVPAPPDVPHPRHRERLWAEVDAVLVWLHALHDELRGHDERLTARVTELDQVIQTNEHKLKEWMG